MSVLVRHPTLTVTAIGAGYLPTETAIGTQTLMCRNGAVSVADFNFVAEVGTPYAIMSMRGSDMLVLPFFTKTRRGKAISRGLDAGAATQVPTAWLA